MVAFNSFVVESDRDTRSRWVCSINCRCGIHGYPVSSGVPCFRLPAAAAGLLLARSRRPVRQSRFCRVLATVNSAREHTQSTVDPILPSPPSPPARRPSPVYEYSAGMAAPSTLSRTQLCGTSHRVGSKRLVSAMDGVLFTAPHASSDPISLPTARRSPPSKLVCQLPHASPRPTTPREATHRCRSTRVANDKRGKCA
ncbi:hypothetical protein LX32DRAFT_321447 [Colletotrichum zoysiae]|uniref:Uncharacterized protein n=1 Tax=Colletotrichum zoysiae TaxID=1216348 RepID=A0AAD9HKG7_9PEZI|nr:hypothetical protein LX32DRAFT_321447 [Colletotrichum zoysiae]